MSRLVESESSGIHLDHSVCLLSVNCMKMSQNDIPVVSFVPWDLLKLYYIGIVYLNCVKLKKKLDTSQPEM